jgi:glycosyltransferase involved in cell wall biosynthesis
MNYQTDIALIIPAFNPEANFVPLVQQLSGTFTHILIINDGSDDTSAHYFATVAQLQSVTLLRHMVNQGKGRALKTACNYILEHPDYAQGAVTIDSDGQHTLIDTVKVAQALCDTPDRLILGVRNFTDRNVPLRSRFGNVLTSKLFKLLCGLDVEDTQTGLRGFSRQLMFALMRVKGERYEYETNSLLQLHNEHVAIRQIPIATIYIDNNAGSHFNPLMDSLRIYSLFLRFVFASISSFIIDILLFSLFIAMLHPLLPGLYITVATILARIFSATYNYSINRKRVFAGEVTVASVLKYIGLSVVQMLLSSVLVTLGVRSLAWNPTLVKIIVDSVLFLISFWVQREFVFANHKKVNL